AGTAGHPYEAVTQIGALAAQAASNLQQESDDIDSIGMTTGYIVETASSPTRHGPPQTDATTISRPARHATVFRRSTAFAGKRGDSRFHGARQRQRAGTRRRRWRTRRPALFGTPRPADDRPARRQQHRDRRFQRVRLACLDHEPARPLRDHEHAVHQRHVRERPARARIGAAAWRPHPAGPGGIRVPYPGPWGLALPLAAVRADRADSARRGGRAGLVAALRGSV